MPFFTSRVVVKNDLVFWTESFGQQENPAILLIMGSGGQGLLWPQAFCEQLANKGFFVIRYDHRDTGLSSSVNYSEHPYNLNDMAEDALAILNDYCIDQAIITGASMGGVIAMLLAANHSHRVRSLILAMTSPDLRASFDALNGLPPRSNLSRPADVLLDAARKLVNPPVTLEEKVQYFVEAARLNSGKASIDEPYIRQLALQCFARARNNDGTNNHYHACSASFELHEQALKKISAPSLIIHGDTDYIFPIDHAYALQAILPKNELFIVEGLGHGLPNPSFYQPIIDRLVSFVNEH